MIECAGLITKHTERDLEILKHRQNLIQAIEQNLLLDDHVLAVFYGGSLGNKNTDLYSDIDPRIVVKDEVFEEYRKNKKQRDKNWKTFYFIGTFLGQFTALFILIVSLR
jgi:hypothetical protein